MGEFPILVALLCAVIAANALPTSFKVQKSGYASFGSSADTPVTFTDGASGGIQGSANYDKFGSGLVDADAYASASASASLGLDSGVAREDETSYGHRTFRQQTQVVAEKTITEEPKVINEETIQGAAQVQRTVIEKTVIPQYVEKTIQVPSYVEKTIRVPTVVEHKVRVPATPKVLEKTYEENGAHGANAGGFHKQVTFDAHASGGPVPPAKVQSNLYANGGFGGGGYSTGAYNGHAASGVYSGETPGNSFHASGYIQKTGLLGNILSIPVATLGAVGNLLHGIGQRQASGSFAVHKNYHAGYY